MEAELVKSRESSQAAAAEKEATIASLEKKVQDNPPRATQSLVPRG